MMTEDRILLRNCTPMDELFKSHQLISVTLAGNLGEKIELCINNIISFEPDLENSELTLISCIDGKILKVQENLKTIILMLESVD